MSPLGRTIAIIEDDESVRRALGRLLGSLGWNVELFTAAEEFLQAPEQPPPACLLLDVYLPGLSGLELQQRLKAAGRTIPIIFMTGHANERLREQVLQAGALALLEKPFEEQVLREAVEKVRR
jgi:FixJ family two-component response regulator